MDKKGFNCKIIGENIRERRLKGHLTQAQLAELADISIVHLSHIENGTVNMSLKRLHAFCNIFFCTPDDILLSTSYQTEDNSGFFMEYGLTSEDQKLLKVFSLALRQWRIGEAEEANIHEV